jgi:hypothetical protein
VVDDDPSVRTALHCLFRKAGLQMPSLRRRKSICQILTGPIVHVGFPKAAATTILEWQHQKFYIIGEETRREFAEENKIPVE